MIFFKVYFSKFIEEMKVVTKNTKYFNVCIYVAYSMCCMMYDVFNPLV